MPWAFPGGVLHSVPEMLEGNTVDGSEMQHPPVDMVNISLCTGFLTSQVVVWDVFHQQQF